MDTYTQNKTKYLLSRIISINLKCKNNLAVCSWIQVFHEAVLQDQFCHKSEMYTYMGWVLGILFGIIIYFMIFTLKPHCLNYYCF